MKKLVSGLVQPSGLILFLVLFGIYATFTKKKTKTVLTIFVAITCLCFCSLFRQVPNLFLGRLEQQYPPYTCPSTEPSWMLVLGHGFCGESGIPASSRVDATMLARLTEALYIIRDSPEMQLVVSIPGPDKLLEKQKWWESWCQCVGLPLNRTVLITKAVDTQSEIQQALVHIGKERFVLVTSAAHIPRAMQIAEQVGGNPLAAPCDFHTLQCQSFHGAFVPSARNMVKLEQALHEYMGMAWFWIVGAFAE